MLLAVVVPTYLAARWSGPAGPADVAGAEASLPPEGATSEIDRLELDAHIRQVAVRYRVPPRLVAAIIEAESEFNPRAVSRRGARGLMQLMPTTAASLQIGDSFDPYANVEGGVRHLRRLMNRFRGRLPLVLAAYNAGEQAVVTYRGIPPYPETRRYVKRIMRRLNRSGVTAPRPADRARPADRVSPPGGLSDVLRPAEPKDAGRPAAPDARAVQPREPRAPATMEVPLPALPDLVREVRLAARAPDARGSNQGP